MATARAFNTALFDMLMDLKSCLSSSKEISMAFGLYEYRLSMPENAEGVVALMPCPSWWSPALTLEGLHSSFWIASR